MELDAEKKYVYLQTETETRAHAAEPERPVAPSTRQKTKQQIKTT